MNPIEFMKANGLDPEDYKVVPTVAVQDKRPISTRRAGKIIKKRRTRDVSDMRTHYIREYFKTGNPDLTTLFVPYLMLDVMQQINAEHLEKVDFAYKERKHHTLMMERYHTFNSLFFQRLTDDERDKVVEMMDAFSAYIENEKEIFRLNCISCIMELPDEFANGKTWEDYEVIPETVGQFTGQLDKNGKKIYEGDIIIEKLRRARKDGERLVICFDDFEWRGKNANGSTTSLSLLFEYHTVEVIGNIHDNPELLKAETL